MDYQQHQQHQGQQPPPPPPPPPPHGAGGPKASGLPPGNYDIFIIPPHSSGSGFLYLPSLQPHRNSFIAGSACTLVAVVVFQIVTPVVRSWLSQMASSGGSGVLVLVVGAVVVGWAYGQSQKDTGPGPGGGHPHKGGGAQKNKSSESSSNGYYAGAGGYPGAGQYSYEAGAGPSPPNQGAQTGPEPTSGPTPFPDTGATPGASPGASPRQAPGAGPGPSPKKPTSGWQRPAGSTGPSSAQSAWERARQETRERKAKEEAEKERVRVREKEAKERKEREEREKEREREREKLKEREREREEREKRERLEKEKEREREIEREFREKIERDKASQPSKSAYASTIGERTNIYARTTPAKPATPPASPKKSSIPSPKKPNSPPKKAYATTEDDAYSYRPYDKPKTPLQKSHLSGFSGASSYAPSQSTARTTPPPSMRGPYATSDPDKIVIRGVYAFNNAFVTRPNAQLVSGVGSVTDGLVLKITTEGLFIDDDVRSVPEREWDVKAWTMKLVEVWCPVYCGSGSSFGASDTSSPAAKRGNAGSRLFGQSKQGKTPTSEELDLMFEDLLRVCKRKCFTWSESPELKPSANQQNGDFNGLHVLRASIRDQEGKRYVFVLEEGEGWKVAVGLQRLRRGTQVRALAVAGIAKEETKTLLGNLGYIK